MPYQRVTLTTLLGLLDNQLGGAAAAWWTQDEKTRYINEGLRFWNALTGYWKVNGVALGAGTPKVTVADQVWYTIPNGTITQSLRVTFNGKALQSSSLHDLDVGRQYWESETTATGSDVPTAPEQWAIGSLNLIAIWPADHVGGNALWADGIAVTPTLSNGGDFINIGDQELNGLLDYWQHIAMFKDGGDVFSASVPQMQTFLQSAMRTNAMLAASDKFKHWAGMDTGRDSRPRVMTPAQGAH